MKVLKVRFPWNLLSWQAAVSTRSPALCAQTLSPHKDSSQIGSGPTLVASL